MDALGNRARSQCVWDANSSVALSAGLRFATRDVDQLFGRYLINGTQPDGELDGDTGCGASCGPWLYYQDPGYGNPNIPYSTGTSNPALAMVVNGFGVGNMIVKNPYSGGMTNPSTYLNTVWAGTGVPNTRERFFEDALSSFEVHEKTDAVYLMGYFGDKQHFYHINVGLRVIHTQLEIDNGEAAESPTYVGTANFNG